MITAVQADITTLKVDAIVNAANETLLGGGGVDGAIHRAAGPGLLAECQSLGGCKTGEARMTAGYKLPARHIIHTVGPVWRDGRHGEPDLLRYCYLRSLELARQHNLKSIAFPCISTGVYGYPSDQAATVAVSTVRECQTGYEIDVTFCCFSESDLKRYRKLLGGQ
jgi:O-acetyl-ADP-ribose deacetylase (regulator of RNase III)